MKSNLPRVTKLFRILEEVSRESGLQPQAIAGRLDLSPFTIRKQIRTLRRAGLVTPADEAHGIRLNPHYGSLIGIDMGASHLHFALADFSGKIISDAVEKVRPGDGPRKAIRQIKKGVHRLNPASKRGRLRAVAMAVPSAVDPRTRLVLMANNLQGWTNIDLKHELEKEFRVPVCIENDANMAAIGEHWRGVARNARNFVFVALGTGVGSGIFINGQLYTGRTGTAGELQFLNVDWHRWNENFGDTGYFESYASGQGLATLGRKLMSSRSVIQRGGLAAIRDARFVFEAFHMVQVKAKKVLETIFTILGVGIANVVGVLDPEMIVLGGGMSQGAPDFMLATVERVARRIQPNCPPVLISKLGDQAQTYGAVYSSLMTACRTAAKQSR